MELFFLNNTPIHITEDPWNITPRVAYNCKVSLATHHAPIPPDAVHVLIQVGQAKFSRLWEVLHDIFLADIKSITLWADDKTQLSRRIKRNFKGIQAVGGIVCKDNHVLFMRRSGRWDLPKGKMEPGERRADTATREILEECGVRAIPQKRICTTWHTYTREEAMLKETTWYLMTCVNDTMMCPQAEEGIEQVTWIANTELESVLGNSYAAIRYVVEAYRRTLDLPA
ncbi:MAG: NUDIX domain-containing protein [Bacteroidota bacterium]